MNASLLPTAAPNKLPYRWPSRVKRPAFMTLIVGIKCKDAIILAGDSQVSYPTPLSQYPEFQVAFAKFNQLKAEKQKRYDAEHNPSPTVLLAVLDVDMI